MRAKIYINETLIDVNDELNLSFTYNISDIREPESRQANYSKTITIPASKTNNRLFSQLFEVGKTIGTLNTPNIFNFDPDFNPNKKADCRVTVDDLEVMNGFCQVLKVSKINNEPNSYDIVIISNVKNIFEEFGEDELTSLDLSAYDQAYTTANVNAYSYGNPTPSYTIGSGVIYNSTYNGTEPIGTYKVAPYPAIFVKTIVDKIFSKYGYQYDSDFFNTNYFKKLCIPFGKSKYTLSPNEVAERQFKLQSYCTTDTTTGLPYNPFFKTVKPSTSAIDVNSNLSWASEVYDISNLYNINSNPYDIVIKRSTTHTVYFNATDVRATFTVSQGVTSGNMTATLNYKMYRLSNGVVNLLATSSHTYLVASDFALNATSHVYPGETFNIAVNETAQPNDTYIMLINVTATGVLYHGITPLDVTIYIDAANNNQFVDSSFYNVVDNTALTIDGSDIVEVNRLLPDKVKIKEFFGSLVKCFNLQVEQDKQYAKRLIIEPYNDYFGSGTEKDWTSKLDIESIDIIPMANLTTNVFKFGFQMDEDLVNKDYSDRYKEVYGDYEVVVNNDFVNGVKEIRPIFAASPCTRRSVTNFTGEVTYLAEDENKARDAKIRMVWYNGLETDSISSPTVAIRFDLAPSELYYPTSTLTNNTLYGKFWAKYIDEVTDKDSKMVVCQMALTPLDIANFSFTDNIFVDGYFFRVNKIIDFNPLNDGLTKVELLKIKNFAPLQEDTITIYESVMSFNVVEGGLDEIRDENAISFYNVLEGGYNEVRDLGATSNIGIVEGGQNVI